MADEKEPSVQEIKEALEAVMPREIHDVSLRTHEPTSNLAILPVKAVLFNPPSLHATTSEMTSPDAIKDFGGDGKESIADRVQKVLIKHGVLNSGASLTKAQGGKDNMFMAIEPSDISQGGLQKLKDNQKAIAKDLDAAFKPITNLAGHRSDSTRALSDIVAGREMGNGYGPRPYWQFSEGGGAYYLTSIKFASKAEYAKMLPDINAALKKQGIVAQIEKVENGFWIAEKNVTKADVAKMRDDKTRELIYDDISKAHPALFEEFQRRENTMQALSGAAPKNVSFKYVAAKDRYEATTEVKIKGYSIGFDRPAIFDIKPYTDKGLPLQKGKDGEVFIDAKIMKGIFDPLKDAPAYEYPSLKRWDKIHDNKNVFGEKYEPAGEAVKDVKPLMHVDRETGSITNEKQSNSRPARFPVADMGDTPVGRTTLAMNLKPPAHLIDSGKA